MFYLIISCCNVELGLFRKCVRVCDEAIDLWSGQMRAFYLKGKALVAMKKHLEAIEVFEEAINSITDNSDGMIALEIRYLYQELMLVVDSEEENEVDNENENLQVESNIVSDNVTDSTGEEVSTVGSVVETPTPPVPQVRDRMLPSPTQSQTQYRHQRHLYPPHLPTGLCY